MPETSIVIKTQDASSDGLKMIAKNAAAPRKAFLPPVRTAHFLHFHF